MSIYFSFFFVFELFLSFQLRLFFFSIHRKSFAQSNRKDDNHSHSANYQNIVTLENERRALSSCTSSNRLQWLGFGLPAGPSGSEPRSNAWTALHHPFTICPNVAKAKVRSNASFATHLRIPCFSLLCKLHVALQLSESISDSIPVQPRAC
jgi:hypothetical protein